MNAPLLPKVCFETRETAAVTVLFRARLASHSGKLSAHMTALTPKTKLHRDRLLGWNKPPSAGTTFAAFRGLGWLCLTL